MTAGKTTRVLMFPGCEHPPRRGSSARVMKRDTPFIKKMRELEAISPEYADAIGGIVDRIFEEYPSKRKGGA